MPTQFNLTPICFNEHVFQKTIKTLFLEYIAMIMWCYDLISI